LAKEASSSAAAEKQIAAAVAEATQRARAGIVALRKQVGIPVVACGVVMGSGRPLPPLDAILRSHAMIHTAEGVLYRNALLEAARADGLRAVGFRAADLDTHALRDRVDALRGEVGAPWSQDHKSAALAAVLALNDDARRARHA
jgi:hypothetical protein